MSGKTPNRGQRTDARLRRIEHGSPILDGLCRSRRLILAVSVAVGTGILFGTTRPARSQETRAGVVNPKLTLTRQERDTFVRVARRLKERFVGLTFLDKPNEEAVNLVRFEAESLAKSLRATVEEPTKELEPIRANLRRLATMMDDTVVELKKVTDPQSASARMILHEAMENVREVEAVLDFYGRAANAKVELKCKATVPNVRFRYRTRYCHEHPDKPGCGVSVWFEWAPGTYVDAGDYAVWATKQYYSDKQQYRRCITDPTEVYFIMEK